MKNSKPGNSQIIIPLLVLIFLPGCMLTNLVQEASEKPQTVQLRDAGMSDTKVLLRYEVNRAGHCKTRCAASDRDRLLANNLDYRDIQGSLVFPSSMDAKGVKIIPLTSETSDLARLLAAHSAAMLMKNRSDARVLLQFLGANGKTNQDVLRIPDYDTYHVAWQGVAIPFALIGDVITFPVQAVVAGILFASGNFTT